MKPSDLDPLVDLLVDLRRRVGQLEANSTSWATVTAVSPLRVRLDRETTALALTPVDLVGNLATGDRVRVSLTNGQVYIVGKAGGHSASDLRGITLGAETGGTGEFTPASGVSVVSCYLIKRAGIVNIQLRITLDTPVAAGNIVNINLGTLAEKWRPHLSVPTVPNWWDTLCFGTVTTGGGVYLAWNAGAALPANYGIDIGGTWVGKNI